MSQEKLSVSVILCVYTEARLNDLIEAVTSLKQQTLQANEVIIVVDHNSALQHLIQQKITDVTVIESTKVNGLSGARNSGIAIAKSSIVAFLDDDVIARPDWLQILCEAFKDSQVAGVGGAIVPHWQRHRPIWFPEEFLWVIGCTYRGMPQESAIIRNPIGANMAFRRDIFSSVGGFRSEIGRVGARPIGCEETELCIRVTQRWPQKKFLYQPGAIISHKVTEKRATWSYFCSRCYSEGLSKAIVSRFVGTKQGLSSERAYILKTLPQGIVEDILSSFLRLNFSGILSAGTIAGGLFVTTTGYIVGSILSFVATLKNGKGGKAEEILSHPQKLQPEI